MPRPANAPLLLSTSERQELEKLIRGAKTEQRLVQRARIILAASHGGTGAQIARQVGVSDKTVYKWTSRYQSRRAAEPQDGVRGWLKDATRLGRPEGFDELFWIDVLSIATAEPQNFGRPITHWTVRELRDEVVVVQELTESIHYTTISRFLRCCELAPHRTKGWMNRKEDPEFDARAAEIKECVVQATTEPEEGRVVVSFDEKTGIQAKQRIAPDKPMQPGSPAKLEFEYKRHGTLCLFGMMLVNTGMILGCMGPTRTNEQTAEVFATFFEQLLSSGYKSIEVLLDQLNTHWSIPLVELVARLCKVALPADSQLKTGAGRRAWLSSPNKAIVFHFTPKHASWLNPIECWFGVLARKVLRRGSFCSTTDLEARVERFIAYYNEKLAHPYTFRRWKHGPATVTKTTETTSEFAAA